MRSAMATLIWPGRLQDQAAKLIARLQSVPDLGGRAPAARLCEVSFADFVFFCHSGAEAMEGVIKMARKYQAAKGKPDRYRLITFEGAFHGRTLGDARRRQQREISRGFWPCLSKASIACRLAISRPPRRLSARIPAGIIIEPLQGEGGVRMAPSVFFNALRQLCDDNEHAAGVR